MAIYLEARFFKRQDMTLVDSRGMGPASQSLSVFANLCDVRFCETYFVGKRILPPGHTYVKRRDGTKSSQVGAACRLVETRLDRTTRFVRRDLYFDQSPGQPGI